MKTNKRYRSLDVFHGAAVCLMILVNNPGSCTHIFALLKHASWHGLTPTDLVFPFFLFAVGYFVASIIVFYFSRRNVMRITGALLLLYWGVVYFGNPADPYSLEG